MPTVKNLAGMLDGGPRDDPREAEEEELLNDGEEAEKKPDAEDENWDFSDDGGEQGVKGKKSAKDAEKPDADAEKDEKQKKEQEEERDEKEEEEKTGEEEGKKPDEEEEREEEKPDERTRYQTIPYQRFRKELTKRHALAAELANAQADLASLRERMEKFEGAARKAVDPEPDAQLDPLGHTQWEVRQLKTQIASRDATAPASEIAPPLARALLSAYRESATAYAEEHKDFPDAYQHAIESAARGIRSQFPTATEEQIAATVKQMELREVQSALANGMDPAERVYSFAMQNGYRAASREAETDKSKLREKIVGAVADEQRKKRASSLATAGTTANRRPLTVEDVDGMSNEELVRFMDRNSGRKNPLAP